MRFTLIGSDTAYDDAFWDDGFANKDEAIMPAVFTYSEAGGHLHNEDSFGGRPHPDDERVLICAIADGMGGQPNGGPAARLAVRTALDAATNLPLDSIHWPDILRQADAAVLADAKAGLTTLVGFSVRGDRVSGASCGDSAVLLLDARGKAVEVTARQTKNPPSGPARRSSSPSPQS